MSQQAWARTPDPGDPEAAVARSADRAAAPAVGLGVDRLPVDAILGLHQAAGNAAVVQLLGAGDRPTAPAPPPRQPDRAEGAGAVPAEEEPAPETLVGDVPAVGPEQRPSRAQREEKRAEGETLTLAEEDVATGGGPVPVADPAPAAGGFVAAGRAGSVPFGDAVDLGFGPGDDDGLPHAFTNGGKTGTSAWGGGAGAGPHGNQQSGSIQEQTKPEIETSWGGAFSNASAWVKEGTGTLSVKRDYVTSSAGDQGNGWFVTDQAAAALEKHEQRHVSQSRSVYVDKLQPMLDRIITAYDYGSGKVYRSSDAAALVQRYVGWADALKGFDEDDKAWNGKGGQVDQEDQYSAGYPRQIGPGKVSGRDFTNRLKMPNEPEPAE